MGSKITIGVLIAVVGIAIIWAIGSAMHDTSDAANLKVGARISATDIEITNQNDFAWTQITVAINSTGKDGFKTSLARLGPAESQRIDAADFANDKGERFNFLTHKASKLYVLCESAKGHGFWAGEQ